MAVSQTKKPKLLRIDQLASRLNVSVRSAYRLVACGHFIALRVGNSLRVREDSVDLYIQRQISVYRLEGGLDE